MRSELDIHRELKAVRERLTVLRETGDDGLALYGAQQALGWVIGTLRAPSELSDMIEELVSVIMDDEA